MWKTDGRRCNMIADTIVVVMMCIMPSQPQAKENRFEEAFRKADSCFVEKHRIDIEMMKKASEEAVRSAALKTEKQRNRILNK